MPNPMNPHQDRYLQELAHLDRLANKMDRAFRVPGTSFRFGWDSVLGLIPGVGDTVTLVPSVYIIGRAHGLGVPTHLLARMGANVAIDWATGLIPLVGDIFDIGYKSNRKNVDLLRRHIERNTETFTETA
ncbi:hypothetical protein BFP70_09615 [Thioclava sp. SK-1]|uniref:DUF4112 domain-containing protein n=1 Tax=Thioclava sp. SK-1 TaxID=1889770 RepID=UPI000824BF92|nr:DUF4112 domain-containing protein [Thioclava sp. SK-1]OCX65316.1 hypothetical protein BFP70_09615 [Thioclava sp. SK-1]